MGKKKHPTNRAERIKYRKLDVKDKDKRHSNSVWRKLNKEQVREKETEDELREYTRY